MKKGIMMLGFLVQLFSGKAQKSDYDKYPVYEGKDLGVTYSPFRTIFKVWAPTADSVQLALLHDAFGKMAPTHLTMKKKEKGIWFVAWGGEHVKGHYYYYNVKIDGKWRYGIIDPYAKSVAINSRSVKILDMAETNPPGWEKDKRPVFKNATHA